MSILPIRNRRARFGRSVVKTYDSFKKGLNTFLLDSELGDDEIVRADNLKLIGKGILEPRGGTGFYSLTNEGGYTTRMITDFYINNNVELLTIGDNGRLARKNETSYTYINGASFASGARPESTQILDRLYIVDGVHPLARYDGTTLLTYTQISKPTGLTATKSSAASGAFTWSWRVAAESTVGETQATEAVLVSNLPETLTSDKYVTLSWSPALPTVDVAGYIIFGREEGGETFLARVPASVTQWVDDGTNTSSLDIFPSDTNTTDGPVAKHIKGYKGKLILGNMADDPDMIMWSGVGQYVDNFQYSKGGGYYSIDTKSGDRRGIVGFAEREGKIIIFKGKSIYQATLDFNSTLSITEAKVQKIVDSIGAVSTGTIQAVENSVMFVANVEGRGLALAKLDYEPNILSSVLRFQPISARVQSIVDRVNMARIEESWSVYYDKKYHWFLPLGGTQWTCLVYDVERLAFVGPWTLTDAWTGAVHIDNSNVARLLIGKATGSIVELSDNYLTDEGSQFTWTLLSRKDDFKKPLQLKRVKDGRVILKDVQGGDVSVSYLVEKSDGLSTTVKTLTINPTTSGVLAGWGSFGFGAGNPRKALWGYNPSSGTVLSSKIVKHTVIEEPYVMTSQIQISGTGAKCKIIAAEITAMLQSSGIIPKEWRP